MAFKMHYCHYIQHLPTGMGGGPGVGAPGGRRGGGGVGGGARGGHVDTESIPTAKGHTERENVKIKGQSVSLSRRIGIAWSTTNVYHRGNSM